MPFRAEFELKSKDCRLLWTKAINSFHSISDSFKIVIYQGNETGFDEIGRKSYSEVQFVTMNKTKTTILNISFKECFFQKFNIEGEITNKNTNQLNHNYANNFTIIVNSKDMNVLFKDCGDDAVSWKIFMLSSNEITEMIYSNKLFVEFKTKNGMIKKYSIRFRPGFNDAFDSKIHCLYLKTLENQRVDNLNENENEKNDHSKGNEMDLFNDEIYEDRVHRIAINTIILYRFIQSFPTLIEDFGIEIDLNLGKVTFKGFNRKQITSKMENINNKPMTLNISMSLDQIVYNNILINNKDELMGESKNENNFNINNKINISFRLKNFKTFIQIISPNIAMFNDDNEDININSNFNKNSNCKEDKLFLEDENVCDIMYSKPGYPIIFERRYFLSGLNEMVECSSVTLTEVSDGESGKILLEDENNEIKLLNQKNIKPIGVQFIRKTNEDININSNKREDNIINDNPLFVSEDYQGEIINNELDSVENMGNIGNIGNVNNNESFENIFWKNRKFHQMHVIEKRIQSEGIEGEEDKKELDENEYLGPTQQAQVKGIFD